MHGRYLDRDGVCAGGNCAVCAVEELRGGEEGRVGLRCWMDLLVGLEELWRPHETRTTSRDWAFGVGQAR